MTEEEYKTILKRMDKASILLKDKWFNPKYKKWVDEWERLGVMALNYEIENDLLPI